MKVVIIGGGEVGFHVAKALSEEDYDITVVDIDPVKCSRASENLDVKVVEGNGASPNTLNEAAVGDADYVLCLTRVDEVNLIASQQAHKLGANRIIARLRNQQYTTQDSIIRPEKFGVDIVIHPERAACEEIIRLVKHPYAVQVMDFEAGRLTMLGLNIDKDCKSINNIPLGKIAKNNSHFRFGVIAVLRGQETIVPWAEFTFQEGDIGYFIVKTEDIQNLMTLLCKEVTVTKRVMIIGGSKIGRTLAKELPNESFNTRLVEYNRPKAGQISHSIDESMIIYGDGTDIEFLKSENIQDVDSFICVTENEKTNLIAGLLAKHLGAKQGIIHVSTTEYIPTIQEIGAGAELANDIYANIMSGKSSKEVVKSSLDKIGPAVSETILNGLLATVGAMPGMAGSREAFEMSTGVVQTNRMELAFKGIGKRSFQYDFRMLPKSKEEADEVRKIVFAFKANMLPEFANGNRSGRKLRVPNTFDIQYMYSSAENSTQENDYLHKISTCVLRNMDVTYGGDRYKTFTANAEGAPPVETSISLQFEELELITKERVHEGF